MRLAKPTRRQQTLSGWVQNINNVDNNVNYEHSGIYQNIEPAGDPLVNRYEGDGITRTGYLNLKGSTLGNGFEVVDEIEAVRELGINIQGYSEINKP